MLLEQSLEAPVPSACSGRCRLLCARSGGLQRLRLGAEHDVGLAGGQGRTPAAALCSRWPGHAWSTNAEHGPVFWLAPEGACLLFSC